MFHDCLTSCRSSSSAVGKLFSAGNPILVSSGFGSKSLNEVESRILEANARFYGISVSQLMENAGRELARFVREKYGMRKRIGVFCGTGNNGGDGFAAARWLSIDRHFVTVFLLGKPDEIRTAEARLNWSVLKKTSSVKKIVILDSKELERHSSEMEKFDVVLDCLLGIGQSGELAEPIRTAVQKINSLPAKVISADVPTGFGLPGAVKAEHTLSFTLAKTPVAKAVSIGIPAEFENLTGPGHVQGLAFPAVGSNKNDNGRVLVIGGSREFHGAPINSVKAASHFCGLVSFSSTRENGNLLERMKLASTDFISLKPKSIEQACAKSDVILVGPGMETNASSKKLVNNLLKKFCHNKEPAMNKKFVLDAGALRVLDKELLNEFVCVTPHAGEFEALFGSVASQEACVQMAKRHKCVVLLKGHPESFIADGATGRFARNLTGNEGMAKGGSGDVLAGLLAAFACKNDLFLSACAAAFANGFAGDLLKERRGVGFTASELLEELPRAVKLAREF